MEDHVHPLRPRQDSVGSRDYILNMETTIGLKDRTVEPSSKTKAVEICYPYEDDPRQTIDRAALTLALKEPVLEDWLEHGEPDKRRLSLYGENVRNPYSMDPNLNRYTFYSAELGSLENRSLKTLLTMRYADTQVARLLIDTANWWLDILAPTDDEMRQISKIFRIHPLTTEDIQAQESREKCEIFQRYVFVSFRTFDQDLNSPRYLEAINFYILVFKDGILTFRFQDVPHPQNVRRRIHQLKDFIQVTPEWVNYALIDSITDGFAPILQHTELEVDSIDDLVLVLNGSEQNDMLRRIGSSRKTVMQLIRLLGSKADVLRSLIKRYSEKDIRPTGLYQAKTHHEVTLYLGDIQDHILTMLQNANHYDSILGRAHRNYLGQITIELSQAGNMTNEVINRLTFFATIIVPLNLIGGLFGMNVTVPGKSNTDLTWFFWIIMGMMVYVSVMMAIGRRTGFI
ncbi:hypothetical protein BY458DRAFT_499355 [Sporodiniella umbellata]|nr:hypothetical protein BY458DRAFT_499355 [Sporodiniella umbellata]